MCSRRAACSYAGAFRYRQRRRALAACPRGIRPAWLAPEPFQFPLSKQPNSSMSVLFFGNDISLPSVLWMRRMLESLGEDVTILGEKERIKHVILNGRVIDLNPNLPLRKNISGWRVGQFSKELLTRDKVFGPSRS